MTEILTTPAKIGIARLTVRAAIREQLERSLPGLSRAALINVTGDLLEAITRPSLCQALQVISLPDESRTTRPVLRIFNPDAR